MTLFSLLKIFMQDTYKFLGLNPVRDFMWQIIPSPGNPIISRKRILSTKNSFNI